MTGVDISTVQPLLQKSLNLMETASMWARVAAKKAHIVGLQGEKRRLRWLYREARNIVDWTEHAAYDVLMIDIMPQAGSTDVNGLTDTRTTMLGIIDKLWVIYNEAHQIANDLVVAKFKCFAEPLYCYAGKLFKIIQELQRAESEYGKASYEYHHISRYQVSYYNVHDEYECKEEEQGYSDNI